MWHLVRLIPESSFRWHINLYVCDCDCVWSFNRTCHIWVSRITGSLLVKLCQGRSQIFTAVGTNFQVYFSWWRNIGERPYRPKALGLRQSGGYPWPWLEICGDAWRVGDAVLLFLCCDSVASVYTMRYVRWPHVGSGSVNCWVVAM